MRRYKDGRIHFNAEDIATYDRMRNKAGDVEEVLAHIERNKAAARKRAEKRAEAQQQAEMDPEVMAFRELQEDMGGLSTREAWRAIPTVEVPLARRPKKPKRR